MITIHPTRVKNENIHHDDTYKNIYRKLREKMYKYNPDIKFSS